MVLTNTELATFFDQMAMILHSGISALEGLSIMQEDAATQEGSKILAGLEARMQETGNLYDALADSEVFPKYAVALVRIGEQTGHLEKVSRSLAAYYQREEDLRTSIRSAVTYPLIMLGMMTIVILILIIKVLPMFHQVFVQLGTEMSGLSMALMNIGTAISRYSFLFIVLLILLAAALCFFEFVPTGIRLRSKLLSKMALTHGISRKMAVSKFAAGMSLTLSSGLDTIESLDMTAELVEHPEVKKEILACKDAMLEGEDFSKALAKSNIFSTVYTRMASIGYKTGALDDLMERISASYEVEINASMSRALSILEPALVAILSVIVGLILLSVMLPLLGIMSNIG